MTGDSPCGRLPRGGVGSGDAWEASTVSGASAFRDGEHWVMPPARRDPRYSGLVRDVSTLLESARGASARAVITLITATYWEIGRRIVEFEQRGARRAAYGTELLDKLSADLTRRFSRGFSRDNLETMRLFYLAYQQGRFPIRRLGSLRTLEYP